MKKQEVIGHMSVEKKKADGWLRKLQLPSRLICLLLAVLLWLIVTCVAEAETGNGRPEPNLPAPTEYAEE